MLRLLVQENWQATDQLGACYCVPPIGGFIEHETGCSLDRAGRIPSHWGCKWSQAGTRKRKEGEVHRMLCGHTKKGNPEYLHAGYIELPQQQRELRWITEIPPRMPQGEEARVSAGCVGERAAPRVQFAPSTDPPCS